VLKEMRRSSNRPSAPSFNHRLYNLLWRPSLVVAVAYLLFLAFFTTSHHYQLFDYVHIGTRFSLHDPHGTNGYDGQFYYYIARDPLHAYRYMDSAPYRYQRILYGIVIYVLSLGNASLIPFLMLFVNFLSIVLSVEIVSRLLARRNLSPWFSLALAFYFGQTAALLFDTAEPFAILLLCAGLWRLDEENVTLAAIFMGLAALTRETTIFFPLVYLFAFLWQRRWWDAIRFLVLAILPLVAWYIVIWIIFGQLGAAAAPAFERIPFAGIFAYLSQYRYFLSLVALILIPTAGGWLYAVREIFRQRWRSSVFFIWVLNLILVTFMSATSYEDYVSCGRISTTLILATLLYAWSNKDRWLLRASQYYLLTVPLYVIGLRLIHA
jgi:hypothetical protein